MYNVTKVKSWMKKAYKENLLFQTTDEGKSLLVSDAKAMFKFPVNSPCLADRNTIPFIPDNNNKSYRVGKYVSAPTEGVDMTKSIYTSITRSSQYTPWTVDYTDGQARVFRGREATGKYFLSYISVDYLTLLKTPDQLCFAQESRLSPLYVYHQDGGLIGLIMPLNMSPEKMIERLELLTA